MAATINATKAAEKQDSAAMRRWFSSAMKATASNPNASTATTGLRFPRTAAITATPIDAKEAAAPSALRPRLICPIPIWNPKAGARAIAISDRFIVADRERSGKVSFAAEAAGPRSRRTEKRSAHRMQNVAVGSTEFGQPALNGDELLGIVLKREEKGAPASIRPERSPTGAGEFRQRQ